MHPILFTIGSFQLHTYGALGALGFMAVVWIAMYRSRKIGIDPERVVDVIFWSSIVGLAGSRVVYIYQNPTQFHDLWTMLNIRTGGLVFYGALLTGLPVGGLLMLRYKLPFYKLWDIFATGFPLGHAITRLGCFSAGCCHGRPTDVPWAVTFDAPGSVAELHVPVHPTQLYEAAYLLVIFGLTTWFYGRKRFDGQVMLLYLSLYAVARSVNEIYRGDSTRGYFLEGLLGQTLSYSQGVSLVVAVAAFAIFLVGARKAASKGTPPQQGTGG